MHTKIGEIMMNVLNVNQIKKRNFSKVLQLSVTRPIQMIENPIYLPLHRDHLFQLHLDIPMSKSIDHLDFGHLSPMTSSYGRFQGASV